MTSFENAMLHEISKKLDKLDDTITKTNERLGDTSERITRTEANVNNLIGWSQNIDRKLSNMQDVGCARGALNAQKIEALKEHVEGMDEELEDKVSMKQAASVGTATGAAGGSILTLILQVVMAFLGK
jgi:tetrahydromethanopterin S-methyltransferase subunit G